MKTYDFSALALDMQQLQGIDSGKAIQLLFKASQKVRQLPNI